MNLEKLNDLKLKINQVADNIEKFQFNKSVAKIYEYVNLLNESILKKTLSKKSFKWSLEKLSQILQPFTPHLSEELWEALGNKNACIKETWPEQNINELEVNFNIAILIIRRRSPGGPRGPPGQTGLLFRRNRYELVAFPL